MCSPPERAWNRVRVYCLSLSCMGTRKLCSGFERKLIEKKPNERLRQQTANCKAGRTNSMWFITPTSNSKFKTAKQRSESPQLTKTKDQSKIRRYSCKISYIHLPDEESMPILFLFLFLNCYRHTTDIKRASNQQVASRASPTSRCRRISSSWFKQWQRKGEGTWHGQPHWYVRDVEHCEASTGFTTSAVPWATGWWCKQPLLRS